MSSAPPSAEWLREYLAAQLQRNPHFQSAEIIGQRAGMMGSGARKEGNTDPRTDPAAEREHLRGALEQLRSECFSLAPEELMRRLDRLDAAHYPDLQHLAVRLRTIIGSRDRLDSLRGDRRFNGDFLACLQQVLTSPPREVNVLREQVIVAFRRRHERRRGYGMIRLLKRELPALYALEQEWLETLMHYKPNDVLVKKSGEADWFTESKFGVLGVIAFAIILGMFRSFREDDQNDRRVYDANPSRRAPITIDSAENVIPPAVGPSSAASEEPTEATGEGPGAQSDRDHIRLGAELLSELLREREEQRRERARQGIEEPEHDDEVMAPFATPRVAPPPPVITWPPDTPQ